MVWPVGLAVFYPYPQKIFWWQAAGAGLLLSGITVAVVYYARQFRYLFTGWFWFLGTLIPVIGIIQVGMQSMADRYTYVPLLGLFIILAWGAADLIKNRPYLKKGLAPFSIVLLVLLSIIAYQQTAHWYNGLTLFTRAVSVTNENHIAHNNLGAALEKEGQIDEAQRHYQTVITIKPGSPEGHNNLGAVLVRQGMLEKAIVHFYQALRLNPMDLDANFNLGFALSKLDRYTEAVIYLNTAVKQTPEDSVIHYLLGNAYMNLGRLDAAASHLKTAVRIDPSNNETNTLLQQVIETQKQVIPVIAEIKNEIKTDPANIALWMELGDLYVITGNYDEAVHNYREAAVINPGVTEPLKQLAWLFSERGKNINAINALQKVIELEPENASVVYNMACLYARENNKTVALKRLQDAIRMGYANIDQIMMDPDLMSVRNMEEYRSIVQRLGEKTN